MNATTSVPPTSDGDAELWTVRGNEHRLQGDFAEARRCFQRAYALTGGSAPTRSNLATLLAQCGEFDEALVQFSRAVELDPCNPLQHSNRAYGLLAAGRLEEGWAEW